MYIYTYVFMYVYIYIYLQKLHILCSSWVRVAVGVDPRAIVMASGWFPSQGGPMRCFGPRHWGGEKCHEMFLTSF